MSRLVRPGPPPPLDASAPDDARRPTADELDAGLALLESPRDAGRLEVIVRRPDPARRERIDSGRLDPGGGLAGDCWRAGDAHPDAEVAVANVRAARLVAGGDARLPLAGDQLFVDLDLSVDNLPPGSRLAVGETAELEVTARPHAGCRDFARWFGAPALAFVNAPEGMRRRLRGLLARVVKPGPVRVGDPVRVLARGG